MRLILIAFASLFSVVAYCQSTFTSVADGDWEDCSTWGTCPGTTAGVDYPGRADNVIIDHNITIDNTGDNGSAGISPDGLSLANVGGFPNSGNIMFYHTGDIAINAVGTLTITSISCIFAGNTSIDGSLISSGDPVNTDLINIGILNINVGSTFSLGDDLVLSGNSETNVANSSVTADDIYLDWTDAILCGSGALTVNDAVQTQNGADLDNQICETFTITCTDGNCNAGSGGSVTGDGYFSLEDGGSFTSVANGDWGNCATWGTCPGTTAGVDYPGRYDQVTINHNVTVNNVGDNGFTGVSITDLNQSNAGPFNGSGTPRFFHVGNITVNAGIFNITVTAMTNGVVFVNGGSFTTGNDYANLGYLEIGTSAVFSVGDDFILTGFSETVLKNAAISTDDIYLDHTDARLCGDGDLTVSDAVQESNGADASLQICNNFTITCSDGNCGLGTGGTVNGGGGFVLPIELLSFTAFNNNGFVDLKWITVSEINNNFFTILSSTDGRSWNEIIKVPGAGDSDVPLTYTATDFTPYQPISYYILKQTDFDGKYTYSDVIKAVNNVSQGENITLFPNPTSSDYITINGLNQALFQVFNMSGKDVNDLLNIKRLNSQSVVLDLSLLKDGVYFVKTPYHTVKFLKK